jgi:hypothetical protein
VVFVSGVGVLHPGSPHAHAQAGESMAWYSNHRA